MKTRILEIEGANQSIGTLVFRFLVIFDLYWTHSISHVLTRNRPLAEIISNFNLSPLKVNSDFATSTCRS